MPGAQTACQPAAVARFGPVGAGAHTMAQHAGLRPLEIFDAASHWAYPAQATALRGLGSSGMAVNAAQATSSKALDEAHTAALAAFRPADCSDRVGVSIRWLLAAP